MKSFLIFLLSLLFLDYFFIQYLTPLYKQLGVSKINLVFGALAYVAMATSWLLIKGDVKKAAIIGFCIYGTYAFTLKALFPKYTLQMMFSELAWGPVLMSVSTLVANKFSK